MLQCWQAVCADAPLARAKGASLLVLAAAIFGYLFQRVCIVDSALLA